MNVQGLSYIFTYLNISHSSSVTKYIGLERGSTATKQQQQLQMKNEKVI